MQEGSTAPGAPAARDTASRRSHEGVVLGLHRGNLRTALIVAVCLVGTPHALSLGLGGALVAVGLALHVVSKGCLRQNRAVAVRGPYRWVRHPFYLANLLIDLGLCVAAARPLLLAVYLVLWWRIYGASIGREEALLTSLFGDAYRRYAAQVPRLLPWRRPLPLDPRAEGFSWSNPNLARGSEYARVARVLSALPLLWLAARARDRILGGATPLDPSDVATALALLGGLRVLQWGLRQRFKRQRPLLPAWTRSPPAVLAWLAAAAGAVLGLAHAAVAPWAARAALAGAAAAIGLLCWRAPRHPASRLLAPGLACGAAAFAVGLPWLAVLAATWFALLALDASAPR